MDLPIFQAPIGNIAGSELAIAVSSGGALGALALTWATPEVARQKIFQIRAATQNPFQVNFVLAFPPHALAAALEAGAPIITFSWGDPTPYLPQVRASGARVGMQVTNIAGAQLAMSLGVDFMICQGVEAGGHVQSTTELWELLPRVVEVAKEIPVVAAGGIGNGMAIAKAFSLGASGVMLGTRFAATQESEAHPLYKQALVEGSAQETALTVCFEGGWPYAAHRVLRNPTLEAWEAVGSPPVGQRPNEGEIIVRTDQGKSIARYDDTTPRAGMTGKILEMCLYAGTSCEAIQDIPPVKEVIERLWLEYQSIASSSVS